MQVTIVGGGSTQWVPTLVEDLANTACCCGARIVLHDLDGARVERTAAYTRHVADLKDVAFDVDATTDQAAALDGADFVVVCISTGGLASMALDLAVSARHGIPMPVGDTVGPAGISRALRNVPVLVGIARAMERRCPDAWLVNVTNPLTALTRAVARETAIKTVGLCHEVTNTQFFLSQLLDCGFFDVDVTVVGVNHLPLVVGVRVGGEDRLRELVDLAHGRADTSARLPLLDRIMADPPIGTGGHEPVPSPAGGWTKQAVIDRRAVNFEILRRFGALPGADGDHTCEFFPGFVTEASGYGRRWGISLVTVDERREHELRYAATLELKLASRDVPSHRSPELVAPVIEALATGRPAVLPLNIANRGQCPDLPDDAVVESMCVVDAAGIRGRDAATAPPVLADWLRRVATSQELTVEASVGGDRDVLLAALLADPLAARVDYDDLVALRDDIVATTAHWLPQFA